MSVNKTLGGDRIGAGKKMQVEMDGYVRSNFDLSQVWRSSAGCGTIIPCYTNIAQKGDTWNFDLSSIVRTKPTNGPLYGSFKIEFLFFAADIRLYNGALHNNSINLGLEMQNVVYPKIKIPVAKTTTTDAWTIQSNSMSPDSLSAYLGITNPGSTTIGTGSVPKFRWFNGMFHLMYWDVVKNFFLNKQEEEAYYITAIEKTAGGTNTPNAPIETAGIYGVYDNSNITNEKNASAASGTEQPANSICEFWGYNNSGHGPGQIINVNPGGVGMPTNGSIAIFGTKNFSTSNLKNDILITLQSIQGGNQTMDFNINNLCKNLSISEPKEITGEFDYNKIVELPEQYKVMVPGSGNSQYYIMIGAIKTKLTNTDGSSTIEDVQLKSFPISNLDKARGIVLKNFFAGENVEITPDNESSAENRINFEPYSCNCETFVSTKNQGIIKNSKSQNGLAIKTYSNDIFNSFLNSDTINAINSQTAAGVSGGQMLISNLILAEKIYKVKNRIAVAGGTYEDWQEAVYGISTAPANETPRFIGGASSEIIFDEVVSSSATTDDPLGTLGGRGNLGGWKGGKFELEVKEDCLIMGIMCITPRVDYSQGNKWFMSLQNNDQLHKPELDRIGFQDLIGDWMCGADTQTNGTQTKPQWGTTKSYAKQPAWINYMTAVNESHGTFADPNKEMFMTLNRQYETIQGPNSTIEIKDFTSYIDPKKYNYAFADASLESQNFWVQIGMDIKVRRVMSQKVMPNL